MNKCLALLIASAHSTLYGVYGAMYETCQIIPRFRRGKQTKQAKQTRSKSDALVRASAAWQLGPGGYDGAEDDKWPGHGRRLALRPDGLVLRYDLVPGSVARTAAADDHSGSTAAGRGGIGCGLRRRRLGAGRVPPRCQRRPGRGYRPERGADCPRSGESHPNA